MVDFPGDESLMTCGLDAWPGAKDQSLPEFLVREERLEARLGVDHFRLPPDYRRPARGVQNANLVIPFVRFPTWHYCPWCGNLKQLGLCGGTQRCDAPNFADGVNCKPPKRPRSLVPARFVAVCETAGHLQDFPFMEWVHRNKTVSSDCRLRLRAGRTAAGLAGIIVACMCGERRTMAGAFSPDPFKTIGVTCAGKRPWLGDGPRSTVNCGGTLQVVQRGASNVYFAHVTSSIYLPLWAERVSRRIVEVLEDPTVLSTLTKDGGKDNVTREQCEGLVKYHPRCQGLDPEELRLAAQSRLDGSTKGSANQSEIEYRRAEFEALRTPRGGEHTDLFVELLKSSVYDAPVRSLFKSVGLVHKLRETRALCGFSRYLPDDGRSQSERISNLKLDPRINWLPANVVRGEGIFLEFDPDLLKKWTSKSVQLARMKERAFGLIQSYNTARVNRGQPVRLVTPEFIMMHTVSHLLINQLSFECGYGSSSIRERIYCDFSNPDAPMAALLLYTASGDSEGTMGGLVRQARRGLLERTLSRSLRRSEWCSYDPVCIESLGQGPDSCNLAACHGCALLPETSCEEGNRLLDRALVIGLPTEPSVGFFGMLLQDS
jgi:hypothetical protein